MPYVGVQGGLVIVSAGDPSLITSPNEQDQRHLTRFLYCPIFDPATPADALEMTRRAFPFSEETGLPVIIRPTTRVCHSSGVVELGTLPSRKNEIRFRKDPARYVPIPQNARRMRQELTQRYQKAAQLLAASEFFPRTGQGPFGIVASGVAYAYCTQVIEELGLQQKVTLLQIGAYPIPEDVLAGFLGRVESVLVVEELTPFVEDSVSQCAFRHQRQIPVLGKHSGHFPLEYEYSPDLVEDQIRVYLDLQERVKVSLTVPQLPPRPPVLCPGCPHRAAFYAARKVFGKQSVYCNDIGCYTLGYGEPLNCCDVLLCMGSSISQASGIARMTGRRTVAYIGDSTFFHSGLPALVNAVQAGDEITIVILDNYVTAMTGFQPSLTTEKSNGRQDGARNAPSADDRTKAFSIEAAARGLGVDQVYSVDPFVEEETLEAFRSAKSGSGVNVVVCHAPCAVTRRRSSTYRARPPLAIDREKCNACSLCVRILGCPGIFVAGDEYSIDQDLCDGCELCARVCQHDAIQPIHSGES
jgi:indolepyruvate ferredoxin oxidoreductase alpha subunit